MALFVSRSSLVPSSPSQVAARAQWNDDGRELLGNIRSTGSQLISVSPGIRATVLDLMARAAPAFARAVNAEMGEVARNAFDRWPVKTGLSKSLLALEVSISSDGKEMSVNLVNRAPYAWFINRNATVMGLVFRPGREAADRMADAVAREVAG